MKKTPVKSWCLLWCILRKIPQEYTKAKTIFGCTSQRAVDIPKRDLSLLLDRVTLMLN